MGVTYINPMTGQQICIANNENKPQGCWSAIGEVLDNECDDFKELETITPNNSLFSASDNIDQTVGDDFTEEDDIF